MDIRFFSLVRILDILGVVRWNRCSCLGKNRVLWLVEVSHGNTQIPSILTRLKNLMSKVCSSNFLEKCRLALNLVSWTYTIFNFSFSLSMSTFYRWKKIIISRTNMGILMFQNGQFPLLSTFHKMWEQSLSWMEILMSKKCKRVFFSKH